jgi:DNA-binding MarR family transcriptional regulator
MPERPYHQEHKSYGPQAKLTPEIIKVMRERHIVGGISQRTLARQYGVNQSTISRALSNQTYQPFEEL